MAKTLAVMCLTIYVSNVQPLHMESVRSRFWAMHSPSFKMCMLPRAPAPRCCKLRFAFLLSCIPSL